MVNENKALEAQFNEAEILAQKILARKPDNLDALNGLGLILMQRQRFGEALEQFKRALKVGVDCKDTRDNFVRSLVLFAKESWETGAYDNAASALRSGISSLPERLELHCHLSFVLSESGKHDEALIVSDQALSLNNEHPHPHDVKGLALLGLGRPKDALESFQCAITIDPNFVTALVNMSSALLELNLNEAAIEHLEHVLKQNPNNAQALNNMGLALTGKVIYPEAEQNLRAAIVKAPNFAEAHFNLSRLLLMQGFYEEGWRENEWRWKCRDFPSTWRDFPYPRWRGEALKGKTILVWSEQGIGDEIMFASPISDLLVDGAKLVLECGERLVPLFSRSFKGAIVVARQNPPDKLIREAQVDYQIPMASLCTYYRNTKEAFHQAPTRYLTADPGRLSELRSRYMGSGKGPFIGICWRSGNPIAGMERSAPLEQWDEILSQPNCKFVSLQYGEVETDLTALRNRLGIEVFHDKKINPLMNAEDWFAQVAAMDLVISVDNSTIQVSGSQGIPTWTLLNVLPEWRFGMEGCGHDWHSSVVVYRQVSRGDWQPVFKTLLADLQNWLHSHS